MKIKIGVLGIGNAGGQVAALAKAEGMEALAINVSEDDTKTVQGITTLVIGNSMGSGKNRALAKKYGKASIRKLLEQADFDSFIRGSQVVFVVYSTGGGTGSALGPMTTAVLKQHYSDADESKRIRFINVGILPDISEALHSQNSTMEAITELMKYKSTYTFYDNGKYADLPVNEVLDKVNQDIVNDFKVIRGDYCVLTKYDSIDMQDMLNIMSFDGMYRIISAVGFQEKDLDKKDLEDMLIDDLQNGSGCELDRDRHIKCIAPIVNIRADIAGAYNKAFPKVKEIMGDAPVKFLHYYVVLPEEEHLLNRAHVIMTGLHLPNDRLTKINQRIEEAKKALEEEEKESSALAAFNETENLVGEANKASEESSLDDILGQF